MIHGRAFQEGCAAGADGVNFSENLLLFAVPADRFEAFADSLGDSRSHGLAGFLGEGLCELVGFGIFDVEAYCSTMVDAILPFYLAHNKTSAIENPIKSTPPDFSIAPMAPVHGKLPPQVTAPGLGGGRRACGSRRCG